MDLFSLLRMLGALLLVLGLMAGALWAVRRFDVRLPTRLGAAPERRLRVVERLSLDARRTLALVRFDGAEHLVLIAPEGNLVIGAAQDRPETSNAWFNALAGAESCDNTGLDDLLCRKSPAIA